MGVKTLLTLCILLLSSACVTKKMERDDPKTGDVLPLPGGSVNSGEPANLADFGAFKLTSSKRNYTTDEVLLDFCGDIPKAASMEDLEKFRPLGEAFVEMSPKLRFFICRGKFSDKRRGDKRDATSFSYQPSLTRGEVYLRVAELKGDKDKQQPYLLYVEANSTELRMGYESFTDADRNWIIVDKTNPKEWAEFKADPKVNEQMRLRNVDDLASIVWQGDESLKLGHLTNRDYLLPFLKVDERIIEREFEFKAHVALDEDFRTPCPAELFQNAKTLDISVCANQTSGRSTHTLIAKEDYDELFVGKIFAESSAGAIHGDEVFVAFGKKGGKITVQCADTELMSCSSIYGPPAEVFAPKSKDDLTTGLYYNTQTGDVPVAEFKLRKVL